jgi:hypothetical protein
VVKRNVIYNKQQKQQPKTLERTFRMKQEKKIVGKYSKMPIVIVAIKHKRKK